MRIYGTSPTWRPPQGSRTARWIIVLLCLATWRGPIPLIHAHGSEQGADAQLERHLQSFHHGHLKQRYFAWHLHLLLPWEKFDAGGSPQPQEPVHDPLTHDGVVLSVPLTAQLIASISNAQEQLSFCDQQLLESRWSREQGLLHLHLPAFRSFVESLLLAAPLCAVTGVALC